MLTKQIARETSTHGILASTQFSIKANGKAFKVLIDGLYSDKIRAVVREIWSNAFDAHAMAGNTDKPFDCHLPTIFAPHFAVRDYGVGMSHDQIMRLYTTVFESSKEDTNDQVGKLGLGSKSPFAYTDTFTVTSYTGTEKRSYSAFIGDDYIPRLAVMGIEASKEPRGIEVSFPVQPSDCYAFQRAAEQTVLGFKTQPRQIGQKINAPTLTTVVEGAGWALVTGAPWGTSAHARQGCVVYPIDHRAIQGLSPGQQSLLQSSLFIDFPIGELEISASRESLGYDEPTKNNIKRAIIHIEQEIVSGFQKEIDECTSMWRAAIKLKKILKGLDGVIQNALRNGIKYRGKQIEASINLRGLGLKCLSEFGTFEDGAVRTMYISDHTLQKGRNYGKRSSLKWEPSTYGNVMLGETTILLEDADAPVSTPSARIRHWYDNKIVEGNVLWVKGSYKKSGISRLLVALGKPDNVVQLSDLEKPPKDPSKPTKRSTVKMKVFMSGYKWIETDVVEEDENIYVRLERNNILGAVEGRTSSTSEIERTRQLLVKLGYMPDDTPIIGVPRTHKNVPDNNAETWTSLWDLAKRAVSEHFDEQAAASAIAYTELMRSNGKVAHLMRALVADPKFIGFEKGSSPAEVLYLKWEHAAEEAAKLSKINDAYNLATITTGGSPIKKYMQIDFNKETAAVEKKYPLLMGNLIEYSAPDAAVTKAIITYVNLLDAA